MDEDENGNSTEFFDFTDGVKENNQVTCTLSYNMKDGIYNAESLHVCMQDFSMYIKPPYFPVRLQIYYNEGKRFFYTTGIIHPTGFYIQYETIEAISRYCLPIANLVPMDKDQWGKNIKSKLAMYGYNARRNELSEIQRRNIIDFVLEHGFMSGIDIINLLERNIKYVYNYYAQDIWRNDIEYVRTRQMYEE